MFAVYMQGRNLSNWQEGAVSLLAIGGEKRLFSRLIQHLMNQCSWVSGRCTCFWSYQSRTWWERLRGALPELWGLLDVQWRLDNLLIQSWFLFSSWSQRGYHLCPPPSPGPLFLQVGQHSSDDIWWHACWWVIYVGELMPSGRWQ